MACPYFVPVEVWTDWTGPRRVPLGEPYLGWCSQTSAADFNGRLCNLGYARGRCPHFPLDSPIDAVRFSIPSPGELIWIAECDHAPVAHGTGQPPKEYAALALAFVSSYEKGKAPQGITRE